MKAFINRYLMVIVSVLLILISIFLSVLEFNSGYKGKPIFYHESCLISGVVDKIEEKKDKTEITVRKAKIHLSENAIHSTGILISMAKVKPEIKHGMQVELIADVSGFSEGRNPGDFNERFHYYINKIDYRCKNPRFISRSVNYNILKETLYRLKLRLKQNMTKADYTPEKSVSSILNTMLLGDKSGLNQEVQKLFQKCGISHILAISGLHIWIIGGGLYHFLRKIGTGLKTSSISSMILLTIYILMIGFGISSFRAYVMLILYFISLLIKRTYHILSACSFSLILCLLLNYRNVFHPGFLLSYSAVYSIILVFPIVSEIMNNKFFNRFGFSLSLSLQVSMLPIIAFLFYEFSPYSLFLNIVIVPLVLPILVLGIVASVTGFLSSSISAIFLYLSGVLLHFIQLVCQKASTLPFFVICFGRPSSWSILIYYLCFFILLLIIRYFRYQRTLLFIGIIAMVIVLNYKNRKELVITMLDIGQGETVFIEAKEYGVIMIDGGSTSLSDGGKRRIENFLKYRGYSSIDVHILTHPDKDHFNGVSNVLKEDFPIRKFILPKISLKDKAYQDFECLIEKNKRHYIGKNERILLGEIELICFHPYQEFEYSKSNEYSIVLYLKYQEFDMMFTGDLEGKGEEEMLALSLPDLDVLKIAHHGSKHSTKEDFLGKVKPEYALISCGEKNPYGHPHNLLLERLRNKGVSFYRTDRNGAIEIRTNGKTMLIRPYLTP